MQVNRTFSGDRYDVTLIADDSDNVHGIFEIHATCKQTGRTSCVTHNNHVIVEFIQPVFDDNEEVEDSTYIVNTPGLFQKLVDYTIKLLEEGVNKHLELAFDDDRAAGEWERSNRELTEPALC